MYETEFHWNVVDCAVFYVPANRYTPNMNDTLQRSHQQQRSALITHSQHKQLGLAQLTIHFISIISGKHNQKYKIYR